MCVSGAGQEIKENVQLVTVVVIDETHKVSQSSYKEDGNQMRLQGQGEVGSMVVALMVTSMSSSVLVKARHSNAHKILLSTSCKSLLRRL